MHHEIFRRIFEACDRDNFSEDKRKQYDQDMYDEVRRLGELATARRMGREEGREEGLAEGQKEGLKNKAVEIALKLMATGMSKEKAAEFVGLSVDDLVVLSE